MKSRIVFGVLFGILFLVGCTNTSYKPLVDLEPHCDIWTICTSIQQNIYNVSGSDCMIGLNTGQAQQFMDIMIAHNIQIGYFKCIATHQLVGEELLIKPTQ
jgi:hypothetical protein